MDETRVSGAILSGGMNLRFGGRNKALSPVGGIPVLDRLLSSFDGLFDETLVVTNSPLEYLAWDLLTVTDVFPVKGSLAGIHTALAYARSPYVFVVACDMPFLKPEVIRLLLSEIGPRYDAVVPVVDERPQPLCAVYAKTALPVLEKQLRAMVTTGQDPDRIGNRVRDKGLKISDIFDKIRTRRVPERKFRDVDPELLSFFNANTPEEFREAEELLAGQQEINS